MEKKGEESVSTRHGIAKGTDAAGRAKARAAPQQAPHGESCPRVLSGAPPAASKAPRRPQRQHDQPELLLLRLPVRRRCFRRRRQRGPPVCCAAWRCAAGKSRVPLAKVKVGVRALVDVLNLEKRSVLVLVDLAPAYLEGTGRRQRRARVGTFIKRRTARRRSRLKKKRMAWRQERTSCSRGCGLCSRGCTALPSSSL